MKKHITKKIFFMMLTIVMLSVSLPAAQAASGPKLNKTKATIYAGKAATVKISGASGAVKWTSKNNKIATVKRQALSLRKSRLREPAERLSRPELVRNP